MRRLALLIAALAFAPAVSAAGDAAKGEQLHRSCLQCHGTGVYVAPKRKLTSLAGLRKATERWADYYNPKFTQDEIADLVAYLNRDFYKFP
jgi:mono/diheme cytochrome c family protein